ncbi:MAG TPA: hypothetical protein VLZ12_03400 [Verrucomicrobiae bacterium]|nr:hypothetical protein [Verrucomicrobiae bacterium]
MRGILSQVAVVLFATTSLLHADESLDDLARKAVSENPTEAAAAIAALRNAGPAGLQALFEIHADRTVLDEVAAQKDSYASRLYWYTDFEKARAAAKASGKPILSLRLLGNLDEEFSCANSRFFRTELYANREVADTLRDHFILHWKSVRPVPKITIDFGDGRVMQRTITGNSIHYVLDSEGRVIDALPGLYGPKAFLKVLAAAEQQAKRHDGLRQFHAAQLQKVFTLEADDVRLDATSRELMRAKFPTARDAGRLTMSKTAVEDPLVRMVQSFERTLAEDTRQNETVLHRRLHEWFANGEVGDDVETLNERVYAELFLTPVNDPWLGLAPEDVYTALPNNGLAKRQP